MAINLDKLYENACENLMILCREYHEHDNEEAAKKLYDELTRDAEAFLRSGTLGYFIPALEIWNAAREEICKASGGTAYTAMKRIIKSAGRGRRDLDGSWIDADGRQCVCDGYRAVRLNKPVKGLPDAKGMDLSGVFAESEDRFEELPLPTPGELKMCIAEQKGRRVTKVYDFGDGLPRVNAEYLKDMMDALPEARAFYNTEHPLMSAIRFVAEGGDGVLLPVRKSD